jgi:hypothetical protein
LQNILWPGLTGTDIDDILRSPHGRHLKENLPEGNDEVTIGDLKYIKFGEIYYQPIQQDKKAYSKWLLWKQINDAI